VIESSPSVPDWESAKTYDYHLPRSRIAQVPLEPRSASRLLVAIGGAVQDCRVSDLPRFCAPGDVVVVNSTRVMRARLRLKRASGAAIEVLLLAPFDNGGFGEALVRPSARVREGEMLYWGDVPALRVDEPLFGDFDGARPRKVWAAAPGLVNEIGEVPLPPYIHKTLEDDERYQTVYSEELGSVAAPTAGLHLDEGVLSDLRAQGADVVDVTLHVGMGTFAPLGAESVSQHHIHKESYHIRPEVFEKILAAKRRVVIGTTVVRTLETAALSGRLSGVSELFITPGFHFQLTDLLLTNFHVPRSTLLCLVAAAVGPDWRRYYDHALEQGYRFLSFGDAMLCEVRSWE
jgi:S-adenosylmethionine:tRNA ribosyltransferase-isomerase